MSFLKDFKDLKKDISAGMEEEKKMPTEQGVQEEAVKEASAQESPAVKDMWEKRNTEGESILAEGLVIEGNIQSSGSVAIYGVVHGDVSCEKKLIVAGEVTGNLHAGEIFINKARVTGEVNSEGNLKVGKGTVILGDVYGKTAVIAGAVKGEVDIHGPLIIDNTAVIRGNIKSASVQINNGAVMEGYCTQCYHDVDVQTIFEGTFPEKNTDAQTETAESVPEVQKMPEVQEDNTERTE